GRLQSTADGLCTRKRLGSTRKENILDVHDPETMPATPDRLGCRPAQRDDGRDRLPAPGGKVDLRRRSCSLAEASCRALQEGADENRPDQGPGQSSGLQVHQGATPASWPETLIDPGVPRWPFGCSYHPRRSES